jgi:hypothetical protein
MSVSDELLVLSDGGVGVRRVKSVEDERTVVCVDGFLGAAAGFYEFGKLVVQQTKEMACVLWEKVGKWVEGSRRRNCGTCGLKYLGLERNSSCQVLRTFAARLRLKT